MIDSRPEQLFANGAMVYSKAEAFNAAQKAYSRTYDWYHGRGAKWPEHIVKARLAQEERYVGLLTAWRLGYSGRVPVEWDTLDGEPIRSDFNQALRDGVDLSPTLVDAAVTYPRLSIAEHVAKIHPLEAGQLAAFVLREDISSLTMEKVLAAQGQLGMEVELIAKAKEVYSMAQQLKDRCKRLQDNQI